MNYAKYIRGKRVCFVGPSALIRGQRQGEKIDDYDIVVKTNGSVFLTGDEYYRDYGSRIDVLYTNHQFAREIGPFPVKRFMAAGVRCLRMKVGIRADEYRQHFEHVGIISEAAREAKRHCKSALMGAIIMTDILQHEPTELHVTGISFMQLKSKVFRHDDYREYFPGYLPDKIRRQGNRINAGKTRDGHDQLSNTRYIARLVDENPVTLPDEIRKLMLDICSGRVRQT